VKLKFEDFSETLNRILKSKTHQFIFDGKYLMKHGMQQGSLIGKVLKQIEEEWINNNFKISKERVKEIIKLSAN
jgi:tRNA nucleotidyltransferase/poly(A) polymerase